MPMTILTLISGIFLSFILTIILGGFTIRMMERYQHRQPIRTCGPSSHSEKAGTLTMGGIFVLPAITLTTLFFSPLDFSVVITLILMWLFSLIGFWDDWKKVVKKNHAGLKGRTRLAMESLLVLLFFGCTILLTDKGTMLSIPYWHISIDIGWGLRFLLTYLVIVGTSNAVNLTDGLDGLVIVPIILISAAFAWVAFHLGHPLSMLIAAMIGAGLGFLWFNAKPARIFMGDTGSLGLGAALAAIALFLDMELLLVVMGLLFVLEAMSVILQVASFKIFRRRIFKMAPLHHHFELSGWSETQVTIRAWIMTVLCVLLGMLHFWT